MMATVTSAPKPVIWIGDSLDVLRTFPDPAQDEIGYALYLAQVGSKHVAAKPLRGLSPGTLEVVSDHRGDTFRAVYTVRLEHALYVLHAFQKKSTHGIRTPRRELDLVRVRLRLAVDLHRKREKQ